MTESQQAGEARWLREVGREGEIEHPASEDRLVPLPGSRSEQSEAGDDEHGDREQGQTEIESSVSKTPRDGATSRRFPLPSR